MNMDQKAETPSEAAMHDAKELMKRFEPNRIAIEDAHIESAVRLALGGPMQPDLAMGVPLLRFADTGIEAVPLLDALINDVRHDAQTCDRCLNTERSVNDRLLVPAGASWVVAHICWRCKLTLDGNPLHPTSTLVWD